MSSLATVQAWWATRPQQRKRAFLVRLMLATVGLVLIGVFLNSWLGLALVPAFLFFLWLRIRRGAPLAS